MPPPLRPQQPPILPFRKALPSDPRVEGDAEAEQKSVIDTLRHEHDSALVSATRIWRVIADDVIEEVRELRGSVASVLSMQKNSELERLARTENEAEAKARHNRRIAYLKVIAVFLAPVIATAAAAIASHYQTPAPPPSLAPHH